MVCGLLMAGRAIEKGVSGTVERAPFVATIAGTLLLSNLACGVACGMVAHVLANALPAAKRKGVKRSGFVERVCGTSTLAAFVVLAVMLVLVVIA